jgi:hypothetical protein
MVVFSDQIVATSFSDRIWPRLRGRNQSEIMFGVLEIVFRGDRIACRMSVPR